MKDEDKKLVVSIEKIWSDDTFKKLILNSVNQIKPSLKRVVFLIVILLAIYVSYIKVFTRNINAVEATLQLVNTINSVVIPIFAVIITGYSIFQALTNGRTLLALLKANENEKSKFQEYNYFFFSISILYLAVIIINFLLSIFLNNISDTWHITFFTAKTNNQIFSILVSIYLTLVVNALIEMKSFIFNLYQVFSANATANAIEFLDKEKH